MFDGTSGSRSLEVDVTSGSKSLEVDVIPTSAVFDVTPNRGRLVFDVNWSKTAVVAEVISGRSVFLSEISQLISMNHNSISKNRKEDDRTSIIVPKLICMEQVGWGTRKFENFP